MCGLNASRALRKLGRKLFVAFSSNVTFFILRVDKRVIGSSAQKFASAYGQPAAREAREAMKSIMKGSDMIRKIVAAALPLIVGLVLWIPREAAAADRFAVIGIENATHVTVRYQHRWGEGGWGEDVLAPGQKKWYWHEFKFANEDKNPPFHMKFDSDLSPGQFWEKYHLIAYRAPDHSWDFSHKYIFKYDRSKNFIDLFDEKH